ITPPNNGPALQRRASRFWRISSFTDRSARSGTPYGERLRAPSVSGCAVTGLRVLGLGLVHNREWGRRWQDGAFCHPGRRSRSRISSTYENEILQALRAAG